MRKLLFLTITILLVLYSVCFSGTRELSDVLEEDTMVSVTLSPNTNEESEFLLKGRIGIAFPVPYFTPTKDDTQIAFDIFPKGTPLTYGADLGVAWIDICGNDINADGSNYETLRLGMQPAGYATISTAKGGTGTVRDLVLQINGGKIGIGNVTTPTAVLDILADKVRLRTAKTPSSAGDTGNQGDICWDADYIYVCVSTNTWKRVAISTW